MTAWLEQAWLVRYLDRQLGGEEAAWFESYAMDKPDLLAGIEADTRLRDALAADASARHTERSAVRGSRQGGAAHAGVRRRSPASPPLAWSRRLALAASLIAGLGLGWTGSSLRDREPVPVPIANPTRLIYDTLRGEAMPPRIENANSGSPVVVIEVAVPPSARDIVLKSRDAHDLPLVPSPDGFVIFVMSRARVARNDAARIEYRVDRQSLSTPLAFPSQATRSPERL